MVQAAHWLRIYIVPAAVFQSVLIGGGYGTGREVVEFISHAGAVGGLGAVAVFSLAITVVVACSFEFARVFNVYDYRSFFQQLIGPIWIIFEVVLVTFLLLVLAVVLAAASDLLSNWAGLSQGAGITLVVLVAMVVIYSGQSFVVSALSVWAGFVTLFLLSVLLLILINDGAQILERVRRDDAAPGWWRNGLQFSFYNMAAIPVLLYTATGFTKRSQVVLSAVITGLFAGLPGIFMHLSFVAGMPGILNEALPMFVMLERLGMPVLVGVYVIVLLGTIIQTAIGSLEGIGARLDAALQDAGNAALHRGYRALLAGALLLLSALLSRVGIIDLVASGYGTMAWFFLAVYVLPLLTLGLMKIHRSAAPVKGMH